MKRILITGASGFIGRNCLSYLAQRGYEVCAPRVDLLDPGKREALLVDIKPTHLLHFAWYAEPKKYWNSDENYKWLQASKALLKDFYSQGGRRVVMAGTCAEYDWQYGHCDENGTPLVPATIYGQCKHALQTALGEFSRETGLSSAWGRIFFLYGPHEHPARLVSSVIISLLQGRSAPCSHGYQVRDFLHVEDVASAFVALLESKSQGAVNIASGVPLALREVINKIGEKIGHPELIRFGDLPCAKDEPSVLTADVKRLRQEVGWRPRFDIDSGLDQTIQWWKTKTKESRYGHVFVL